MVDVTFQQALWVYLFVSLGVAAIYGGQQERLGVLALALAAALTAVASRLQAPAGFVAVDLILLLALGIMTYRWRRWWPIVACACHITAVVAQGYIVALQGTPEAPSRAFTILVWLLSCAMQTAVMAGALTQQARIRMGLLVRAG